MPFILAKTNLSISAEQEITLKTGLGKLIELIPGKSEKYLLVGFESNYHLYLQGQNSYPIAYIETSIFGNEEHMGQNEFAQGVTQLFGQVLGIKPQHIYIKFNDISSWSVGGIYIDRKQYD